MLPIYGRRFRWRNERWTMHDAGPIYRPAPGDARASCAMKRDYVDTSVGQLHVRLAGARDGVPLVLIHQSPSSGAMWEPILPELGRRGYFVVAPDLIGHGASDEPDALPTLHEYGDG